MELSTWLPFFAASWAISLSPGPGAVAAMSSGLNHGFARGYFMTFGLVLGIWTQIVVIGLGLDALIASSQVVSTVAVVAGLGVAAPVAISMIAFATIKWLGVAYLVWLGIKQWRAPVLPMLAEAGEHRQVARHTLVLRGWMVNVLNPKGTVFLLAVVPQFLDFSHALVSQYAVIAATLGFTDLMVMAGYTALASRVLRLLKAPRHIRILNRSFGSLFVLAGGLLALFKRV